LRSNLLRSQTGTMKVRGHYPSETPAFRMPSRTRARWAR
jgi:hypothetical protein